jgi:hypothetical protein
MVNIEFLLDDKNGLTSFKEFIDGMRKHIRV